MANEQAEQSSESESSKKESGSSDGGPQVGTRFSASEITENITKEAEEEMERPASELLWSGLASGLIISFSFLAVAFLHPYFPGERRHLAAAIAYPLGFIFVVLARHQLFTENTLEPVIPVLQKRDRRTVGKLFRLWGIVLPLNLIGTLLFALVLAYTKVVEGPMHDALAEVAADSFKGGFVLVLYKGIWAGWLVALMAWIIASTRETIAQIVLVWLTTAPIAGFGFKHSIAGATEAWYLAATGHVSWMDAITQFEIPAILGNVIGGVVLVALINHGQTASSQSGGGEAEEDENTDPAHHVPGGKPGKTLVPVRSSGTLRRR